MAKAHIPISTSGSLVGGNDDPEITDSIFDYYLPQAVRSKLGDISNMRTFNDFKSYFATKGVSLTSDSNALMTTDANNPNHTAVYEQLQIIVTAYETYTSLYGKKVLSKLKRINVYDNTLDTTAAYHYDEKGSPHDPWAGTIRIRNWSAAGRVVFHEMAHAMQDSLAKKGEDAVESGNRIVKAVPLPSSIRTYTGVNKAVIDVERFADAMALAFSRGNKYAMSYVMDLKRNIKKI